MTEMTWQQLDDHLTIVEKLAEAREIVQGLRASLGLKAQNLSGMPRGSGVGDVVGNATAEINRLEERIEKLAAAAEKSQKPIEEWIDSIDSIYTQTILRLRFLYGLPWKEVADMVGGRNTAESVKMVCYRLFPQNPVT